MTAATLDIDMGNTRIKWRFWHNGRFEFGVSDYHNSSWLAFAATSIKPTRVRVSSVVGDQRRQQLALHCQQHWRVCAEFAEVKDDWAGVRHGYRIREHLGVDRWLALLAAKQQIGSGIVVSCGSAVTVDVLLADGRHLGGYIVPGIGMMHRSLFSGTDAVKVDFAPHLTDLQPGNDTGEAVNKGVMTMLVGLIDHAIAIYLKNSGDRPRLLITGGDGETVKPFLPDDSIYNPSLVLDGLALALP